MLCMHIALASPPRHQHLRCFHCTDFLRSAITVHRNIRRCDIDFFDAQTRNNVYLDTSGRE